MQNEREKISEESFQKTFVIFSIFIHEKSLGACLSVKLSVKLAWPWNQITGSQRLPSEIPVSESLV